MGKAPGNVEEITHGKKSRRQRHSKYDVKSQVATLKAVTKRRGRILAGASFSNHKNLLRLLSPVEVEKWARIRPKQVANKN